jgi:hypothetical protein
MRHLLTTLFNLVARKQDNKIDMVWYDQSPCTKERIAELRYKLAVARGMLIAVHNEWVTDKVDYHGDVHRDEINKAIKESSD